MKKKKSKLEKICKYAKEEKVHFETQKPIYKCSLKTNVWCKDPLKYNSCYHYNNKDIDVYKSIKIIKEESE